MQRAELEDAMRSLLDTALDFNHRARSLRSPRAAATFARAAGDLLRYLASAQVTLAGGRKKIAPSHGKLVAAIGEDGEWLRASPRSDARARVAASLPSADGQPDPPSAVG